MKRFTVPCDFNGVKHPFHVYIGNPHPKKHPLQFQAWWLSSERGGTIPQDVMDSFEHITVADRYEINGETTDQLPYDLCDPNYTPLYKSFEGWHQKLIPESTPPKQFEDYITYLERHLEVPISIVSVGPERDALISRP